MAVTLTYTDAYLATRVTEAMENEAFDYVDTLGSFPSVPTNWRNLLTVLRAYIIACMRLGAGSDDVFAAKQKQYRAEFEQILILAKQAATQAQTSANNGLQSPLSVEIGRA